MPRTGNRHQLLVYVIVLDRWWRSILAIGLVLLVLALGLGYLPVLLEGRVTYGVPAERLLAVGGVGVFAIVLALILGTLRKFAYVQAFENHLRLVTPFLRLKISYRRIRQSSTAELGRLFPPKYLQRKLRLLRTLEKHTLVVLDLNGLPLPRAALALFLSPLFFPDSTPRLALLVPDWIMFSTELESFRSAYLESQRQPEKDSRMSLFSDQP